MIRKHKFLSILITVFLCLILLTISALVTGHLEKFPGLVLGEVSVIKSPVPVTQNTGITAQPTPASVAALQPTGKIYYPKPPATPTPIGFSVTFINIPKEPVEGSAGTFTWIVNGPQKLFNSTGVYFGTVSYPGNLDTSVKPADTGYTGETGEFINGKFTIPLIFTGNMKIPGPGTYFARAYALIDNMNYWSEELSFTVKPIPKNSINIVSRPTKIKKGENAAFTWEIVGPANTTTFTVIVAGKTSKSGSLDESVDIPQTPYAILVKDFSGGTYNVPLRFVGNGIFSETGEYFFRALAFINEKNIWSDEYSLTVE